MRILVINGPNINMLGIRQPDIYGSKTYDELVDYIKSHCEAHGVTADFFQSNHEGAIIDIIQAAYGKYDGIVINAGAYTHTSLAIADALRSVNISTSEVHLSDINTREEYRKHSFIREAAVFSVCGKGFEGYIEAIDFLYRKHFS